jgi:hypothetical protein
VPFEVRETSGKADDTQGECETTWQTSNATIDGGHEEGEVRSPTRRRLLRHPSPLCNLPRHSAPHITTDRLAHTTDRRTDADTHLAPVTSRNSLMSAFS